MLLGTHDHTLDDKNRLTLPSKFRESFAEGLIVARGLDRCLRVFRREDWDRLVESREHAVERKIRTRRSCPGGII